MSGYGNQDFGLLVVKTGVSVSRGAPDLADTDHAQSMGPKRVEFIEHLSKECTLLAYVLIIHH